MLTWVPGRIWSSVNPQLDNLRYSLGEQCGKLTAALNGYEHPTAHRKFEWDIAESLWTKQHLSLFEAAIKEKSLPIFKMISRATKVPMISYDRAVVHNDANDNNVIVSEDLNKS